MKKGTRRSLATAAAEAAAHLTAKRIPSRHGGLEGWYPYYAGYTEQFAKSIIANASHGTKLRILDPWNGSGTTTRAALTLGHQAIGFDINPVATLVASAKLANPEDVAHVRGLVQRLASFSNVPISTEDPLLCWMGAAAVRRYRTIESHILAELATNEHRFTLDPRTATLPPLASFLLLALMRAARGVASIRAGSNPTWTRPAERIAKPQGRKVEQAWAAQISEMSQDLLDNASPLSGSGKGSIHLGNSTNLPLDAGTVDLVVTSPPYCTRIDYAMGAAFELAALGVRNDSDAHRVLRAKAMGTPLSRRRDPADIPAHWPSAVRQTLHQIKTHASKASATYYYKTYFQYFDDCMKSLSEMHRVLRKDGAAVLVVQSSYYKDVYVDLPELYVKCAEHLGYKSASVGSTTVVRKALAQINSKSRVHRSRKVYEESAVVLSR